MQTVNITQHGDKWHAEWNKSIITTLPNRPEAVYKLCRMLFNDIKEFQIGICTENATLTVDCIGWNQTVSKEMFAEAVSRNLQSSTIVAVVLSTEEKAKQFAHIIEQNYIVSILKK